MVGMSELSREQLLQELEKSQQQVSRLLETVAAVQDWQPDPVEWSFRYIAAHLATVERTIHLRRVNAIASGETPHFSPYSHVAENFAGRDLVDSLHAWAAARRELLDRVRALSTSQLALVGVHETVGPMTILDVLQELLDQDRGMLRHVDHLITALEEEQPQGSRHPARPASPPDRRARNQRV
jgi:hypothetical protein